MNPEEPEVTEKISYRQPQPLPKPEGLPHMAIRYLVIAIAALAFFLLGSGMWLAWVGR